MKAYSLILATYIEKKDGDVILRGPLRSLGLSEFPGWTGPLFVLMVFDHNGHENARLAFFDPAGVEILSMEYAAPTDDQVAHAGIEMLPSVYVATPGEYRWRLMVGDTVMVEQPLEIFERGN